MVQVNVLINALQYDLYYYEGMMDFTFSYKISQTTMI